jgi:hypothetical protein
MVIAAASQRWNPRSAVQPVGDILAALEVDVDDAARREMEKIFHLREYFHGDGSGHLTLLIRTITESEGNEGALIAPVISAVSSVMRPQWTATGIQWIAAFDRIPLLSILETMRGLHLFRESSLAEYLGISIQNRLWKEFGPDAVAAAPKVKMPKKPPARIARIALIEKRIDLGLKLLELKAKARRNNDFSAMRKRHFGDVDPVLASETTRVARIYGSRPDIFRRASWRALVELSSPSLSTTTRQRFEAAIRAGKDIKGPQIARARGPLPSGRPRRNAPMMAQAA